MKSDEDETVALNEMISFMTPSQFMRVKLPELYHLLIDEFHNCCFDSSIFDLLPLFNNATSLMGLSGSPLERDNISFIQQAINGSCVVLFKD